MNTLYLSPKSLASIALIASMGLMNVTLSPFKAMSQTSIDSETQQAMIDAINDEYRSRALYNAAIEKFGSVRPFSNIVQAEERHVNLWIDLFDKYGIDVPADSFANSVSVPDTLKAVCEMAVQIEIENVAMYDRFLGFVTQPDLQAAFTRLRQVSQERHLPAFERCVNRSNGGGGGRGRNR